MAENLIVSENLGKEEKYKELLPQLEHLIEWDGDYIANLANIMAALRQAFNHFWVGVYIVKNDELVLGPFQGPVACTRIAYGKGVCGSAWKEKKVLVVEDVDTFPGHIACNSASRSEIVLPAFDAQNNVFLVLDIDSDRLAAFDETDSRYLGRVISYIERMHNDLNH